MPYIKPAVRELLATGVKPSGSGELSFTITRVILDYLIGYGLTYQTINDILGALTGAQLEFYRRIVVPYEEQKCKVNGDVYSWEQVGAEQ